MIEKLNKIKNGKITKVIAGGSNGSIIVLDIKLDDFNFVLFIYCSWRLSAKNKGLASSSENSDSFVQELLELENSNISDVSFNETGDFSLKIGDKRLDVFCDSVIDKKEEEEEWDNWSICDLRINECTVFTNRFDYRLEPYSE